VSDEAATPGGTWGGAQELSAWEALMWRSEADPRTRSTGILLEILDGEPDWDRLVRAHERITRLVPRLRERVVEPQVPVVQPVWSADPNFDIEHHLHRTSLSAPGTHGELIELCETLHRRPLDRARPPWESVLVTGLEGGRAALLFKVHHSLADGLGLMQLLELAHSTTAKPSTGMPERATIGGPVVTPTQLLTSRVRRTIGAAPSRSLHKAREALRAAGRVAAQPRETVGEGVDFARSLGRMLSPPAIPRSPLLANTQTQSRLVTFEVPLDRLRAAARAAGGSLNDAYVAGFLGALRLFHEHHDAVVEEIPIGMPVSLRTADEPMGGNKFTGARLVAPLSETDPAARIRLVGAAVRTVRDEPAIAFLDHLSPALTKLPSSAIIELSASLTAAVDLNISNIRGSDAPLYVAGCRVQRMFPLGPRPGVALMAAMITYDGTCCIGLNVDAKIFPDRELLEVCLRAGFDEVLALAEVATTEGPS
jgi:diacylglycerol O-acyltransferase / wax synthase